MNMKEELLKRLDIIASYTQDTISKVASKVEATAEYLFPVLIKKSIIDGIQSFIWCIGLLVLSHTLYGYGHKVWKFGGDGAHSGGVVLWILSGGLSLGGIGLFCDGLSHICNPTFYAIENILNKFRNQ